MSRRIQIWCYFKQPNGISGKEGVKKAYFSLHIHYKSTNNEMGKGENKQVSTHSFCGPGDHMQTVICWFDVHTLKE